NPFHRPALEFKGGPPSSTASTVIDTAHTAGSATGSLLHGPRSARTTSAPSIARSQSGGEGARSVSSVSPGHITGEVLGGFRRPAQGDGGEMRSPSRFPHGAAHGQETMGGVTNLSRTTSQSACRTDGPIDRSRPAAAAIPARHDATSVVSTNHPIIGAPP